MPEWPKETRDFLRLLHDSLPGHIAWLTMAEGQKGRQWWSEPGEPPKMTIDIRRVNVWASVCSFPDRKREKKVACGVPGLWADLDAPKRWAPSDAEPERDALDAWREAKLRDLQAYRPPPTAVVDSGTGYQAYWLFDRPRLPATEEERAALEAMLRTLAVHVDGDQTVAELARILRVPGTTNLKPGRGPCRLVSADGPRYTFEELAEALTEQPTSGRMRQSRKTLSEDVPIIVSDRDTRMILEMAGIKLVKIQAGERNDRVFRIAASLRARGMSLGEMVRILDLVNATLCQPALSPDELEKIALSASHYAVSESYAAASEQARRIELHAQKAEQAKVKAEERSEDFEAAAAAAVGSMDTKLDLLARTFGVRIERVIQVGRDHPNYYLEIRRAGQIERIYIGPGLDQPRPIARALIAHGIGATGMNISNRRWPAILQTLLDIRVHDDDSELERKGETRGWVLTMVGGMRQGGGLAKTYDAIRKREPFEEEGFIYLNSGQFFGWVRGQGLGSSLTGPGMVGRMREIGFIRGPNTRGVISIRGEEGAASAKYWRVALADLDVDR